METSNNLTSHRARSTIASQLANARDPMSLFELMEWLGHKSPQSTVHGSPTLAWGSEAPAAVWSDPPSFGGSYKVWPSRVMTAAMWRART